MVLDQIYRVTVVRSVLLLIVLSVIGISGTVSPVKAEPEVVGNPTEVRYEGTGGLILPESIHFSQRDRVSRCKDCDWRITPACVPGESTYCDAGIRSCPGLIDHVRTWIRVPGGSWEETGLMCLTSTAITTVSQIDRHIQETFYRYIPELKPTCWPSRNLVTNLPLICASGQNSQTHSWGEQLAGHSISVNAAPHWHWRFNDRHLTTTNQGGPFPDLSVSHVFRRQGVAMVGVDSLWRGSFSVDGLGPFIIEQDLRQSKSWEVTVGEARARLIQPGW